MENYVKSYPNSQVAIICEKNNNKNNTYTLIPVEVSLGKVDKENIFHSENGEYHLKPVSLAKDLIDEDNKYLYIYCDSLENIRANYQNVDVNVALINYFKEIASHLILALIDGESVSVYATDYRIISPEIGGEINKKKIEPEEIKVANVIKEQIKTNVDLNQIDNEDLENYLKTRIFNNDEIIEDLCTTIAMNYSASDRHEVESMLSIGTTGTGKTETYRLIAEYLGVPLVLYDCTQLTAAGYVGKDMDDVLRKIYRESKGDINLARKAIVAFDEFDKVAARGNDVTDLAVQYDLLKFIDGFEYQFALDKNTNPNISLDTSFMTVGLMGAFSTLIASKKKYLGFNAEVEEDKDVILSTNDFVKYGMIEEIMGRINNIYQYKTLSKDDLKKILLESLTSPLILKKARYIRQFGTEIECVKEFIDAIVEEAYNTGAGGRSLGKIISRVFKKLDRELCLYKKKDIVIPKKLILKPEMVIDPTKFEM